MTDFFISYARSSSAEEAKALCKHLIERGHSVFLDETEIPFGSIFPEYLANGITQSKVIVVFATELYFLKPWCVLEFQTALAPYRERIRKGIDASSQLNHIMILFQKEGGVEKISALLPPPLSVKSWPRENELNVAVEMAIEMLKNGKPSDNWALQNSDDPFTQSIRNSGLVPSAAIPINMPQCLRSLPHSLGDGFIGRAEKLWEIYTALELKASNEKNNCAVIQGTGGMGKTQLAAEYVHRYGFRFYEGGIVWIDADTEEEQLVEQFKEVLKTFSPHITSANSIQEISIQLQTFFNSYSSQKKILWVIDNIPEPQKGAPPKKLDYWCPVRNNVSLLGTSRQAGIKDADVNIQLTQLTEEAGIRLLTQPPIKKSWLQEEDWKRIIKWVGSLPFALRIIQTGLVDGYLTVGDLLKKISGDEPAQALDEEVDSIRDEVAEDYLKSIAELFNFSYQSLQEYPLTLRTLSAISMLAPIPVSESLLLTFCDSKDLGILAKRSWITLLAGHENITNRHYTVHRMASSYIRGKAKPDDYGFICDWFQKVFSQPLEKERLRLSIQHFRVFSSYLAIRLSTNSSEELRYKAIQLGLFLSEIDLGNFDNLRGLRFISANFLDAIKGDNKLIEQFSNRFLTVSEEEARSMVYVASGLYQSEVAAEFMKMAFFDSRDMVRWQAFVQCAFSSRNDILLVPLLDALMLESNKNVVSNSTLTFASLLKNSGENGLRNLISNIANHLSRNPDAIHRKLLVSILGSTLDVFGHNWKAGGWTSQHISKWLLDLLFNDMDEKVQSAALTALSYREDPQILSALLQNVTSNQNAVNYGKATELFLLYVKGFEKPPRVEGGFVEEDGEFRLELEMPLGKNRPDLYEPLIQQVICEQSEEKLNAALTEIFKVNNANMVFNQALHKLLGNRRNLDVIRICNSIIKLKSAMQVNGYWWRGQALYSENDHVAARDDFSKVLEISPSFSEAYYWRALCYINIGDEFNFYKDVSSAISLDPANASALIERAKYFYQKNMPDDCLNDLERLISLGSDIAFCYHLKSRCLIIQGQFEQAVENSSKAIELDDQNAKHWFFRGYGYYNMNKFELALSDFQKAHQLNPSDTLALEYVNYLKSSAG